LVWGFSTAIGAAMVLTNFECWAHGDPSTAASFETGTLRPSMDPFNPRAVPFMTTDANNNSNNNNNSIEGQTMPAVLPLEMEVLRCKKRLNPGQDADVDQPVYTKRCRYDEADLAAQYCNGKYYVHIINIFWDSNLQIRSFLYFKKLVKN